MINNVEKREKYFIELIKQRDEIYEEKKKIPFRKLSTPIQEGWLVDVVLIDEAARRVDAPAMAKALSMCCKTFVMRKGSMQTVSGIRKNPLFHDCRKWFTTQFKDKTYYHGPELHPIKENVYKEQVEAVQKWFRRREHVHISKWGGAQHVTIDYVLVIPFYYYQLKVRKRMLTQIQDINPELLKREAFIDDKLEEWYRTMPYRSSWYDAKDNYSTKRRHVKDALTHLKKGEIEDLTEYHKNKL